jgi:chromosome condensin MukBEF ATPase and DNA-binding subunit MukB
LAAAAARLTAERVELSSDSPDLSAERTQLEQRLHAVRVRLEQMTLELKQARTQVAELEAHTGAPHPELLRLRDVVGGELLARRFEDLEPDVARHVEAELGPLLSAIVVEDADAAAAQLLNEPRDLADVWLIDGRTELQPEQIPAKADARDLLVATPHGVRLTRIPEVAHLGRTAREQRAASLRRRVKARSDSIEQEERALTLARSLLTDLSTIDASLALFRAGDPSAELLRVRGELDELNGAQQEHERAAREAADAAQAARAKADLLRPLVGVAGLLDTRDPAPQLQQLEAQLAGARSAKLRLESSQAMRAVLRDGLEALAERA